MNRICAVLAVVVILAGCASNEPVADTGPVSEPTSRVELETEAPARTIQWPMPRRPVFVGDPMPFGDSMFGPWRTGIEEDAFIPDPTVPISPLGTPLFRLLMILGASAGLELEVGLCVPFTPVFLPVRGGDPKEAIRSLCKANKLDLIADGNVWMIKARPQDDPPVHVTKGDFDGYYDVDFEGQELIAAIMEVAQVTGAQVLIPSCPWPDEDIEEVIRPMPVDYITLSVRNATADHILRELARLGNKDIEVIVAEGDQPAHKFKHRR